MRGASQFTISTAAKRAAICILALCFAANSGHVHGASNPTAAKTPAKKTSTTTAPAATFAVPPPPTNMVVSVFSTDDPRDPFHPQNKPKAASATVLSGVQGEAEQPAVVSSVQAGFQGIYGAGEDRELLVYGVLMRENHEATVIVPVNGQHRKLKVKPLKIYRNAAELQVEGVSQTVTVPKPRQ